MPSVRCRNWLGAKRWRNRKYGCCSHPSRNELAMAALAQVNSYACRNCGWADFHPVSLCPRCNGEIQQTPIIREGEIVTYTVIRYPPRGFENQAPYVVAIIDLKEGPRVIGRITNPAEGLKIGSMVSLSAAKEGALEFQLSNQLREAFRGSAISSMGHGGS